METMRIALNTVRSSLGNHVIIHVKTSLPADYAEQLQAYLEYGKEPECEYYDPAFPWDSAGVGLLYFGLKAEPDEWTAQLPDGRTVRVWNINPGCQNDMAKPFEKYSRVMDTGRRVLLAGGTAEDAVAKMCEFCRENDFLTEEQADSKRKANWLEEMVEYRELLREDSRDLGIETGLSPLLSPAPDDMR